MACVRFVSQLNFAISRQNIFSNLLKGISANLELFATHPSIGNKCHIYLLLTPSLIRYCVGQTL